MASWLTALLVLTVGVFVLVLGPLKIRAERSRLARWPKVSATVVRYAEELRPSAGKMAKFRFRVYRFQLNGRNHEAQGPDIRNSLFGKEAVLPVGQQVVVAYNPTNPTEALSEQDASALPGGGTAIVFGLLLLIAGGYGLVAAWRGQTVRR